LSGTSKRERDVVKQNKIKCNKCNEEFRIKDDQFRPNKTLRNLIESKSYLSNEEKSLKQKLEESIRKYFEYFDEFAPNKGKLELDILEHFQEIRFKIDEQREELKKRIDEIALKMIDDTKIYQEKHFRYLKENFSSFDGMQSLKDKLNDIEDTFRNPNILLQTIDEMQTKQEESINYIQLKLNEMNQVKEFCEEQNEFKPNVFVFDQEGGTSLFGSIRLYELSNSFNSQILISENFFKVIDLCEFSRTDKWSLLYRGTRDGFSTHDSHSNCDGHSNTLTILKAKASGFIFGGYTTVDWDCSNNFKSDPNAFIFSLTNKDNQPMTMKILPDRHEGAIYCNSGSGPTFGDDFHVYDSPNKRDYSSSNLGHTYTFRKYEYRTNEAQAFLAGSHKFKLDEIEVYQKE
jgi:hypothetical protein